MNTYVDIHIVQDLPPSCVNRDDSGSPKSAIYGGVQRLRISSQSWKRATRHDFTDYLDASELGTRTKRVVEVLAKEIARQAEDLSDQAQSLAEQVFQAAKITLVAPRAKKGEEFPKSQESSYLIFLSHRQIAMLAELAIASDRSGKALDKKAVKAIFKSGNSIDVALFGRMVADDADLNVDAACQVAHAISTHAVENEFDFYTAVDDEKARSEEKEDAGAGMMGTVEFSSATIYRYATINIGMLLENLGNNEATLRALTAFIRSFIRSMPTGKQNTFANRTLPDTVVIHIREDQPVSFVGAFEKPVAQDLTEGYVTRSVRQLADHERKLEETYGFKPLHGFAVSMESPEAVESLGERISFADLDGRVREVVARRLPGAESE